MSVKFHSHGGYKINIIQAERNLDPTKKLKKIIIPCTSLDHSVNHTALCLPPSQDGEVHWKLEIFIFSVPIPSLWYSAWYIIDVQWMLEVGQMKAGRWGRRDGGDSDKTMESQNVMGGSGVWLCILWYKVQLQEDTYHILTAASWCPYQRRILGWPREAFLISPVHKESQACHPPCWRLSLREERWR